MPLFDNREMQRFFIFIILFFTCTLFSQESFVFEQYDTPFVFDLEFQCYGRKVLLTWKNPDNFQNNLLIYRSNSYISSLQNTTRIARLTDGENKYIDNVESGSNYYYSVLIEDKNEKNKIYMLFIPYRNTTVKPVVLKDENNIKLTSLKAFGNRNVQLQWDFTPLYEKEETNKLIYIFRSLTQIENEGIFENATFALKTNLQDRNAIDVVSDGVAYYYYAWVEGSVPEFLPDVTYTTKPISVNIERKFLYQKEELKFTPLPLLVFREDPLTGQRLNRNELENIQDRNAKMSDFRNELHENWSEKQKKINNEYGSYLGQLLPFNFLKDEEIFVAPLYTDKYKEIQKYLRNKDYKKAKEKMEKLLSAGLPIQLYERINYYLGAICYCSGDFYNSYLYLNCTSAEIKEAANFYLQSLSDKIYETLK